jgi:hypothetical protein
MMATKAISDWLMAQGETDTVVSRAKQLLALERLYANCVPETLARASAVANLRDGILLLRAENGAVASKLRQLAPTLLGKIQKTNQEVTQVQVTVQVTPDASPAARAEKPGMSPEAMHQVEALAESLPESSLKTALARMTARQRRYLK